MVFFQIQRGITIIVGRGKAGKGLCEGSQVLIINKKLDVVKEISIKNWKKGHYHKKGKIIHM